MTSAGERVVSSIYLLMLVVPVPLGAVFAVRAWLPSWSGPRRWLAQAVLSVSAWLAVAQALAAVSWFTRGAAVLCCVAVGSALGLGSRRLVRTRSPASPTAKTLSPPSPRWELCVAFGVAAVVIGAFAARSWGEWRHGILDYDSLYYHLDHAARLVHDRSLWHLDVTMYDPWTSFHPENGELLQALFMLPFHADVLAPFVNLVWLGLALLASWCCGLHWRQAPLGLVAGCLVIAMPIIIKRGAGTGEVDVLVTALVLSAVALFLSRELSWPVVMLGGLAAGAAIGAKLTALGLASALTVGVIVIALRKGRPRAAVAWVASTSALSAVWYVRNLVLAGNPVPTVGLRVGPLRLPSPPLPDLRRYGGSVADYGLNRAFLHTAAADIRNALGPLGLVWLALAVSGIVAAAVLKVTPETRVLAVTGAAAGVVYLFTPTTAYNGFNTVEVSDGFRVHPFLFGLGFILLVGVAAARAPRLLRLVWVAYLAVFVTMEARMRTVWSLPSLIGLAALGVAVAVATAAVAGQGLRRWLSGPPLKVAGVGCLAAGVALVAWAEPSYLRTRYSTKSMPEGTQYVAVWRWASGLRQQRIGYARFLFPYPLYGPDLSNTPVDVGQGGPHGAFAEPTSCAQWRRLLVAGRYTYVVIGPYDVSGDNTDPPSSGGMEARWTSTLPGSALALQDGPLSVFDLRSADLTAPCGDQIPPSGLPVAVFRRSSHQLR